MVQKGVKNIEILGFLLPGYRHKFLPLAVARPAHKCFEGGNTEPPFGED